MNYIMKLNSIPFQKIQDGIKTIELRLFDEKRQQIQVGDTIHFTEIGDDERTITTEVTDLVCADSFKELFNKLDYKLTGSDSKDDWIKMREIYSEKREEHYGVLGIYLKVL